MRKIPLRTLAALILMPASAAFLTPALARPESRPAQPVLATSDQIEAEQVLRDLLGDPELKAEQARLRAELANTAIGQTADGAARIDEAVAQWTNSLIFREVIADRSTPAIVWGTDDTPRTWLGYTIGGAGTSGDSPDNIYRSTLIAGDGRYEIVGRFDPARRPAQFVLSVAQAKAAQNPSGAFPGAGKPQPNRNGMIAALTDRDLKIASDGSFRVTLGGAAPAGSANHVDLVDGAISVGFRDVLSNWAQKPSALMINRLDQVESAPLNRADVRRRVIANLASYIGFWSKYPETFFGGLKLNSISEPVARDRGWGFLSGARFKLQPDEAMLVTTTSGGAHYNGIQVVDPWMIAASAKEHQTSLNPSQVKPNPDGSFTYIIAPRDPGVANWLDSAGLHEGFAVLRWQQLPIGATGQGLVQDFRVIKLSDAVALPGIAKISPAQRRVQLSVRAEGYSNRTR